MMRDYKFRVCEHGFQRQTSRHSRRALRIGFLALAAGISYALVQILTSINPLPLTSPAAEDSEVIKRPLPPVRLQEQVGQHQPQQGPQQGQIKYDSRKHHKTSEATLAAKTLQGNSAAASAPAILPIPFSISNPRQLLALSSRSLPSRSLPSRSLPSRSLPSRSLPSRSLPLHPDQIQQIAFDHLSPKQLPWHHLFENGHQQLLVRPLTEASYLAFAPGPSCADPDASTTGKGNHRPRASAELPHTANTLQTIPRQGPFRLDYQVQAGDTFGAILQSQGIANNIVHQILASLPEAHRRRFTRIRPGEIISLHLDQALELERIELKLDATERLLVSRNGDDIATTISKTPTETRRQSLTAVVENSLYGAAKNAGIPDHVTQHAVNIFRHQINFARQTRKGDQLSVVFEQDFAGDKPIKTGPVLAVEITNGNKNFAAVRYTTTQGVTDYYSADGEPIDKGKHSFLRAPLNYTRVSSGFSLNRIHPILHRSRPHTGVDLAAPAGRRVVAAADGKIYFKGRKSGYGNILILRHGSRYETRYAHLMRFSNGLSNGSQVSRGQTIGYVGQTGLATGPHLHYEIRIDGKPVDPMTAKLPFLSPFDDREKARFRKETRPLLAELQRNKERALLVDTRRFDGAEDGLH